MITGLTFEDSYCGSFKTFFGFRGSQFFTGSNEEGKFKIMNSKDFYYHKSDIEKLVTKKYESLNYS